MLQLGVVAVFLVAAEHVPGADVAVEDAIDVGVVRMPRCPRLLERGRTGKYVIQCVTMRFGCTSV
jgi:hypothetical protein